MGLLCYLDYHCGFFCLFLQSCSVSNHKLGVNYVSRNDVEQDLRRYRNGAFPIELRNNIQRLENQGFVGPNAQNDNVNVRKHLMFVFYHCLRLKQEATVDNVVNSAEMMQNILDFFAEDGDAEGLMFTPVEVVENNQRVQIKFILNNFLTNNDPNRVNNMNNIEARLSPEVYVRGGRFLVEGNIQQFIGNEELEIMEIDHLLRDNIITIELPSPVHNLKTRFIDKLTSSVGEGIERNARRYWRRRLQELP